MPRYESDVCIIGGGISAAAGRCRSFPELKPGLSITIVEAGLKRLFDKENRMKYPANAPFHMAKRTSGREISSRTSRQEGIVTQDHGGGRVGDALAGAREQFLRRRSCG